MATTNKAFRVKSGLIVEGAELKPAQGTATYPPILLTSGTNLTSAQAGSFEYDGTRFYLSPSTTRKAIALTDSTGVTLDSTITGSSLTSVGTLLNLSVTNTITGSISGNAATATNGVVTTGTYSNPSWITGLAWSKISTTPTTLSGYGITDAASSTHTHGNITNTGNIGVTSSLVVVTGASGAVTVATNTNQSSATFLRGDLTWVTPTDTNTYPTTWTWTDGTTAGPTASITGTSSTITVAATPSASATVSGVVTTGTQTFAGTKTLTSPSITTSLTTSSSSFDLVNTTATTVNFAGAGTAVGIGASTGNTTVNNNLIVTGNLTVNGTTTTVNSTTVTVDDIVLELGAVASPTDTTANGGGISLLGATNKTILWDSANTNWTSSENWNLASGKVFKINNASTLSATTLGTAVVNSSLTKVGALSGGTAGFVKTDASGNLTSDSNTYLATSANFTVVSASGSTTGTTALTLSTVYASGTYNGGEFIIKATNSTNIEITKVLVITDGTNVYMTTYGDVYVSADLVNVDFTYTGANVNMVVTPVAGTTGTTTVKVTGTLLAV
jgi:hypothetical protein